MNQARALAIVGALISGASFSAGVGGGRWTAPAPPAVVEVIPAPACAAPTLETAPVLPAEPVAPPAPIETPAPPPAVVPPADVKPAPPAKVEAKPKAKPKPSVPSPKPRPAPAKRSLPSCAVIKREYARMTAAERWAEYLKADAEQVAHGRRCLGM